MEKNKVVLYLDRVIFINLCLLIFCLPFAKAGVETFAWLSIVLWIFKRVFGYRTDGLFKIIPKTILNLPIGIFVLINALSMIYAVNLGLAWVGFFGKIFKFLMIYIILVETINTKIRLKHILIAVISSVALLTIDAFVQLIRGRDFLIGRDFMRLSASFYSANGFSAWLLIIIPFLIGLLMSFKKSARILKACLAALIILLLICLIATYVRGAWLGFMICIIFMLWQIIKKFSLKRKMICLSLSVLLIGIFLILPQSVKSNIAAISRINFRVGNISTETVSDRIKSTFEVKDGYSVSIRLHLWKESLRITRDYHFIGCGVNNYSKVARNYKSFEGGGVYPHNSYLHMAAEIGVLGLFSFLWIIFAFLKMAIKHYNDSKDYLVLGFSCGMLAFSVQAFFDTHFYSLQLVVLFWFILGLTTATINLGSHNDKSTI